MPAPFREEESWKKKSSLKTSAKFAFKFSKESSLYNWKVFKENDRQHLLINSQFEPEGLKSLASCEQTFADFYISFITL